MKEKYNKLEDNKSMNSLKEDKSSLLVREVAKIASKEDVIIGEKRLWQKLRDWGLILQKSTEPKQVAIERGYFEIYEGSKEVNGRCFSYRTTRVTKRGQIYIINRLLKESSNDNKDIN